MSSENKGAFPDVDIFEEELYDYISTHYKAELLEILESSKEAGHEHNHFPLVINYVQLFGECPRSMRKLTWHPDEILSLGDRAALRALMDICDDGTRKLLAAKRNIHLRLHSMPVEGQDRYFSVFPGCEQVGTFMTIVGTVIRTSSTITSETMKEYKCTSCKQTKVLKSSRNRYDHFPKFIDNCPNGCQRGKLELNNAPLSGNDAYRIKDYQEIKVQEHTKGDFAMMPKAMWVILEDDLVDSCKPGDDVVVTGILFARCRPFRLSMPIDCELAFKANHIQVKNDRRLSVRLSDKVVNSFKEFWKEHEANPFKGRNLILRSFCPQVYGMYLVKLALNVVLAGGVSKYESGSHVRGEAHLLLVGDPGVAKSQLLKYTSKIIPRSVFTTGTGTTTAGLTVTSVKEGGSWHLEAGALVLADGGVCCIDEFSTIKEHDRVSIHEAMEQQTISVAKAGIVSALRTKCTIIAATNPKFGKYDQAENLDINVGLPSPLLSRFDLVMVLKDAQNDAWDELLADFILGDVSIFEVAAKKAMESGSIWNGDMLRCYMVYIKENDPVMTDDAENVLSRYYHLQRNSEHRNAARTTVRLYESLFRLAEGHARLMFQEYVLVHDAIIAISLIEASMQSSALLGAIGSTLHIAFPEDPFEEYYNQGQKILQLLNLPQIWATERARLENLRRSQKKSAPPPPPDESNPFKVPEVPAPATARDNEFDPSEFFKTDGLYDAEEEVVCSMRITSTQQQFARPEIKNTDEIKQLSPIPIVTIENSKHLVCTQSDEDNDHQNNKSDSDYFSGSTNLNKRKRTDEESENGTDEETKKAERVDENWDQSSDTHPSNQNNPRPARMFLDRFRRVE